METDIKRVEAYITNKFRHFTNVTGYPVEICFHQMEQEKDYFYSEWLLTECKTNVIVYIEGIDPWMDSRQKHYKRLQRIGKRIEKRFPFVFMCISDDPKDIEEGNKGIAYEVSYEKELEKDIQNQPNVKITRELLEKGEEASLRNREMLVKSNLCGCYSCRKIFKADQLADKDFCDDGTACCPYCGMDSVLGDANGYPMTPQFIRLMNKRWFNYQ